MRQQGWNGPDLIGIEIVNVGRRRAKITQISATLVRGGMSLSHGESNPWSSPLPHWLEPAESATWYIDADDVRALIYATRRSIDPEAGGVVMSAKTATGGELVTRRQVKDL